MNKFLVALLLTNAFRISALCTPIHLSQAIANKQVSVVVTGNPISANPGKSAHTGKCLLLHLSNHTNKRIECSLESSWHFSNQKNNAQDIINAENELIVLQANEKKTIAINGFCGEKENASPSEKDSFRMDYRRDENIVKLNRICEKYKQFDNTGQQAIWCFTDNNNPENIYDTHADTVFENTLIAFVAAAKGLPVPKRRYMPVRIIRYPVEIDTSVALHVERNTMVGIHITNNENQIVTSLFDDEREPKSGNAKYTFLYRGQLPKGSYFVKLKKNNEWIVLKEIKVE